MEIFLLLIYRILIRIKLDKINAKMAHISFLKYFLKKSLYHIISPIIKNYYKKNSNFLTHFIAKIFISTILILLLIIVINYCY